MASPVRIDPKLARWLARESRRLTRLRKRPVSRVEVSRELGEAIAGRILGDVTDRMQSVLLGFHPAPEPVRHD